MTALTANLNDRMIERLAPAKAGQYVVRDTELRGFYLVVGVRQKTFMVRGEFWKLGKRESKSLSVGLVGDTSTREARILAKRRWSR